MAKLMKAAVLRKFGKPLTLGEVPISRIPDRARW